MGIADEELGIAVANLRNSLERLSDGVATQLADGSGSDSLDDQGKQILSELLKVAHERLTHTRRALPDIAHPVEAEVAPSTSAWLPLNRKERFYTGTVLPGLVGGDGFAHLQRLLDLCGLPNVAADDWGFLGRPQDLTFFTEYGFAESVFTEEDRRAWPTPVEGDTPDVVVAGPDWLLAIEAKMFHNPNGASLEHQMDRQRILVDYWSTTRGLAPERVRHVLLLPEPLARRVGPLRYDVLTWEQVLDRYDVVGPRYWSQVLRSALSRHAELVSRSAGGGSNADHVMSGGAIASEHAEGALEFTYVGRNGGLKGKALAADVATGAWRTTRYEVRREPLPGNNNWFSIAEFLSRTAEGAPDGGAS